ncbi:MAG: hypothetical protein AB7O59_04440 [Pirellulales bacterium]
MSICCLLLAAVVDLATIAAAADFYLADVRQFPGQLWLSRDGAAERLIFRSQPTANPAFPRAVMKVAQVAVGPQGEVYFASGLDGNVLHLLDGRHEVLSFEYPGQIRDLDCGGEEHTVYFSVVATPQNGETLADGKIYRRDLWAGQPSEAFTVRQAELGGNWWGTMAIRDGVAYLATLDVPSRIFKLAGGAPERVFEHNTYKIDGLTSGADGNFYFTDGSNQVFRTTDFQAIESVWRGNRSFTDVAVWSKAPATAASRENGN